MDRESIVEKVSWKTRKFNLNAILNTLPALIGYQICLAMVLRWRAFKR